MCAGEVVDDKGMLKNEFVEKEEDLGCWEQQEL